MKNGANPARAKSAMSGKDRQQRRRESSRRSRTGTARSNPESAAKGTRKIVDACDHPETVASETHSIQPINVETRRSNRERAAKINRSTK